MPPSIPKRHLYKRIINRFYEGHKKMGTPRYNPQRKKFKSPTIALLNWGEALTQIYITILGRILFVLSFAFFLYSLISLEMPIHLFSFFLVCFFLINIIAGFFCRPKVEVHRILPMRGITGIPVTATYQVKNIGKETVWDICLDNFHLQNIEISIDNSSIHSLKSGETILKRRKIRFKKRGLYQINHPFADSAFPFGLWKWGCFGEGNNKIIILPDFIPLENLDIPNAPKHQKGDITILSRTAETLEFQGCREYREGDNPRHIHWAGWARTNTPIVKEYRDEYLVRAAIIMDTFHKKPFLTKNNDVFESAISLTASIADALTKKECIVDFFAAGNDVYSFHGGNSPSCLENILDILACVEENKREQILSFSPQILKEIQEFSCVIFVFLKWDESRKKLVKKITDNGIAVKIILVTTKKSENYPDIKSIHYKNIQNGEVVNL